MGKAEKGCVVFREEMRRVLGGQEVLPGEETESGKDQTESTLM